MFERHRYHSQSNSDGACAVSAINSMQMMRLDKYPRTSKRYFGCLPGPRSPYNGSKWAYPPVNGPPFPSLEPIPGSTIDTNYSFTLFKQQTLFRNASSRYNNFSTTINGTVFTPCWLADPNNNTVKSILPQSTTKSNSANKCTPRTVPGSNRTVSGRTTASGYQNRVAQNPPFGSMDVYHQCDMMYEDVDYDYAYADGERELGPNPHICFGCCQTCAGL